MRESTTLLTRDPAGLAPRRGEVAVERRRRLVRDERAAERDRSPEALVLAARPPGEIAVDQFDVDPGIAETGEAASARPRVGVVGRDDDAGDAGSDDGLRTRGRATVVGAGLERHVERRS